MDKLLLQGLVCFLISISATVISSADPSLCEWTNRNNNLKGCLDKIVELYYDTNAFWFGSSYKTRCPPGTEHLVECTNPDKIDESIVTRIFRSDYTPNITTYLEVNFTSTPGQFEGCGNTFSRPSQVLTFNINPLSDVITHPWDMRLLPDMAWASKPGEFYTLVVYDVGSLIPHAVIVNIEGNDLSTAEHLDPYHGPLTTRAFPNVYVFMVFRQDGHLTVPADWAAKIAGPGWMGYVLRDMLAALNLTGPIGINWMQVSGDEYAAGVMQSRGIVVMCPLYVGRALELQDRPFIKSPVDLRVDLNVTFSPPELNYTVCCSNYHYPAQEHVLNPIGNGTFKTAEVRSEANPAVSMLKIGQYFVASNFSGDTYSLIACDPDVPFDTVGTEEKPLLHWMVLNIKDGDVTTGSPLVDYNGPSPPDDQPHSYYFLLYKHDSDVNTTSAAAYSDPNCPARLAGRCLYDISRFTMDHNMTLIGASWMRAERDDYVIYRNVNNGQDETVQCKGQPNYADPCPTAAASTVTMATVSTCVVYILSLLLSSILC